MVNLSNRLCGIVILNYKTYFDTCECIDSVFNHESNDNFHIYIVDNCSKDGSLEQLVERYSNEKRVSIIPLEKNLGFSGGNNKGIDAAIKDGAKYVFLLNSDIVLLNDAISKMMLSLEEKDQIVAVGPSVVNLSNDYSQYAKKGLTFKSFVLDKKIVRSFFKKKAYRERYYNYKKEVLRFEFPGMASGCCLGFKASFLSSINYLDDHIFLYYEEDSLAHIIKKQHLLTVVDNSAKVVHKEGASTKKIAKSTIVFTRFHRWISSYYVLKKYASISRFSSFIIYHMYRFIWTLSSIFNKEFFKMRKPFIKQIRKIKRNEL